MSSLFAAATSPLRGFAGNVSTPDAARPSRPRRRPFLLVLAVVLLALIAASCSGGDDNGTDAAGVDGDQTSDGSGSSTIPPVDGLAVDPAEQRADIVAAIGDQGFGIDGGELRGPADMRIDLAQCPSGWDPAAGVTPTQVAIGLITARSGPFAAVGERADGFVAYAAYLNDQGGIGPGGLELIVDVSNDGNLATQNDEIIAAMLADDQLFAVTTTGITGSFNARDRLNAACIPQALVDAAHQAWGDPENHPWTTGLTLTPAGEAALWGQWIADNFDDQVTVAGLVMDNDFGLAFEQPFARIADDNGRIDDFIAVRHNPGANNLDAEMAAIANADPDVVLVMTTGPACLLAVNAAAEAGLGDAARFLASPCESVDENLAPAGPAADGWYGWGGGWKDASTAGDEFVDLAIEQITAAGFEATTSRIVGFSQGWVHGEALQIAAALDGGLTRPNYMLALRSLELAHPGLVAGVGISTNGNDDVFAIEGSQLNRFDASEIAWVPEGSVIDLDGRSQRCVWIPGEGC